ncbi:peptide-methionine (R)-S-oxide reductase MsrB [Paraburkholderia sp. CNPSo 3157]|uniref:peptide-methionine (R)-S-oxide reductase n=1 Tax=Paraburkholderia franconis TaxID=2654983 RepID=A0A7X1TF11_9BURK|nr:peptide-methionine (R)-S-oxide reductase MsrB [Paraburkholderia franconis]MPW16766.1 peptide-methionine (R)-S-oxide reductase MsrB [Paraburkholderia franconis]
MKSRRQFLLSGGSALAALAALTQWRAFAADTARVGDAANGASGRFEVTHTDTQWRQMLTPAQYHVLREEGTERPFSSPLNDEHRSGVFACAGCKLDLFSSRTKFDSHTGWPSFWAPLDHAVATREDGSFGMVRTEVHCRRCGGHLGHVFDDGPKPTGLRYCMNGLAMTFTPQAA